MKFNQSKYANEYNKKNYERLNIQVPKGKKEVIEEHWKKKGYKSLNQYVNDLIKKDMENSNNLRVTTTDQQSSIRNSQNSLSK